MLVTEIVQIPGTKRYKVRIEGEETLVLYYNDLRRYRIQAGEPLSEDTYERLIQDVILKRCKARALHLLQSMDRTEEQLRRKLVDSGYPQAVVEAGIAYVKQFHYIDDQRYAENYMRSRGKCKSRRQMLNELRGKGVDEQALEEALPKVELDEEGAIAYWIEKKGIHKDTDPKVLQRFYGFMMRRGFQYEDVRRFVKND